MSEQRWARIIETQWSQAEGSRDIVRFVLHLDCSVAAAQYLMAIKKMDDDVGDVRNVVESIGVERSRAKPRTRPWPTPADPVPGYGQTNDWDRDNRMLIELLEAAGVPDGPKSWSFLRDAITELRAAVEDYTPVMAPEVSACMACGAPPIVRRRRRDGKEFTACTRWPECKWTYQAPPAKPNAATPVYARRKLDFDK